MYIWKIERLVFDLELPSCSCSVCCRAWAGMFAYGAPESGVPCEKLCTNIDSMDDALQMQYRTGPFQYRTGRILAWPDLFVCPPHLCGASQFESVKA